MKASIKIQVNDRIKRLLEREYSNVDDLKENINQAFELNSSNKLMKLSYLDEDNEKIDILTTDDLKAAIQNAQARNINLKVQVNLDNDFGIEEVESEEEVSEPVEPQTFMDELKKSIMELRLDEEPVIAEEVPQEFIKEEIKEEKPEVPEEPLKDF